MDYKEAWQFLDNLQFFKIKLGLSSMSKFMGRLGHPEEKLRVVHVGGTNGKGSVAKTIMTIMAGAGCKVGLYTSPHLTSVRERFMINDSYISEDDFAANSSRIFDILAGEQITYFEFTTALALQWFAEQQVDLAILEVGMGGRLDATNIITPLVSVITNVSMDHEEYLGRTLAEVAAEKAGIIKAGVPLVSGVLEGEAQRTVRQRARELDAPLLELDRDFRMAAEGEYRHYEPAKGRAVAGIDIALRGEYQGDNTALALAAVGCLAEAGLAVDDDTVRAGVAGVRWPGRLEYFTQVTPSGSCRYLLDGAHNPAGVQALAAELKKMGAVKIIMVWAAMADKEFGRCLRLIAPFCREIIFTRPEENRSATPEQLRAELHGYTGGLHAITPVAAAMERAGQLAASDDLICVAGSLYLVGRARAILLGEVVDA